MAITKGGIAFTFYDSNRWSTNFATFYPQMQKVYPNWKATFYADEWHNLTTQVKNEMLAAQAAGIEIANHQYDATSPNDYLATPHTEEEFWTNMVENQQNNMIAGGITAPTSLAYSGGEAPRTLTDLIISKASAIKLVLHKTCGIFSNPNQSKGYYKSMFSQGLGGIGHEDINSDSERSTFDLDYIISQLDYCKQNKDVYIHSGHTVAGSLSGGFTNLYSTIQKLSRYCACNGMEFYTINDLVQAGFVGTERSIPSVSIITITGTQSVGNQLVATYTYQQSSDVAESGTTRQWYRADDAQGTNAAAIAGATNLGYTLVGADSGKYVRIGITPRTASEAGYEVFTKWFAIS